MTFNLQFVSFQRALISHIKKFINNKNFNNKIIIKTNLKYRETVKYYKESDLFILPSVAEPASISVLKQWVSTPVICARVMVQVFMLKIIIVDYYLMRIMKSNY